MEEIHAKTRLKGDKWQPYVDVVKEEYGLQTTQTLPLKDLYNTQAEAQAEADKFKTEIESK